MPEPATTSVAFISAKPKTQHDKDIIFEMLQTAQPMTIIEDDNPFADRTNNDRITKKLDFSRMSNPCVNLYRESANEPCNDENVNTQNMPSIATFNAPLNHVNYQQTFEVKPSANVINIFAGSNIDDYIKQIAQVHP